MKKFAVLISGSGTNLQAIINACQQGSIPGQLALVISDQASAYGLVRAEQAGIATAVIERFDYASRQAFEQAMIDTLTTHHIELIVLAGFMRILSTEFVQHYPQHILNIHPSLLPKYPGLDTHQRALAAQDPEHGCTVHWVTEVLDAGPILAQASCSVTAEDNPDTLKTKVQQLEHQLYPKVIAQVLTSR